MRDLAAGLLASREGRCQDLGHIASNVRINHEVEGIWKEAVVA
jgi:hypothetical protein